MSKKKSIFKHFEFFIRSIKEIAVPFLQIFFVIFATISVIASLDALFQYAGGLFDFQDLTLVYVLKYVFFPFIWILGLDEDKAFEVNINITLGILKLTSNISFYRVLN